MSHFQTLSLSELLEEAEAIAVDVRTAFGGLSPQQINWKPSAESWSVGQCLNHLTTGNLEFFPQFDQIVTGTKTTTIWERIPILPGFFGKMMIRSLSPDSTQKFKAPAAARPSASAIEPDIVSRFVEHQVELISKLREMATFDPANVIITSPFVRVVTYSALDSARLIVAHERRHFAQAQRVQKANGFPR